MNWTGSFSLLQPCSPDLHTQLCFLLCIQIYGPPRLLCSLGCQGCAHPVPSSRVFSPSFFAELISTSHGRVSFSWSSAIIWPLPLGHIPPVQAVTPHSASWGSLYPFCSVLFVQGLFSQCLSPPLDCEFQRPGNVSLLRLPVTLEPTGCLA